MTTLITTSHPAPRTRAPLAALLLAGAAALLGGCKHDEDGAQVAGWALIDSAQRHPILVSQKPTTMSVRVARGSVGLTPQARAQVLEFAARFRASDSGSSRLVVAVPSGASNEVSAMQAAAEIRDLLVSRGFSASSISVEAYSGDRDATPPILVSYMTYVAEGPECGNWTTNLARQPDNLPYPEFGCSTQRNFAAQVANPADLLGPRSVTPRPAARREVTWDKYVKGESTNSSKSEQETVKVKGN